MKITIKETLTVRRGKRKPRRDIPRPTAITMPFFSFLKGRVSYPMRKLKGVTYRG